MDDGRAGSCFGGERGGGGGVEGGENTSWL